MDTEDPSPEAVGKTCNGRFFIRAESLDKAWEYRPGQLHSAKEAGEGANKFTLTFLPPSRRRMLKPEVVLSSLDLHTAVKFFKPQKK